MVSSGSLDAVASCSTSGPVRPSVRLESRAPVATLKTTAQLLGLSGFVRELADVVLTLSAAAALQRCVGVQNALCLAVEQLGVLVAMASVVSDSNSREFRTSRRNAAMSIRRSCRKLYDTGTGGVGGTPSLHVITW